MRELSISKKQKSMVLRAITWMISNLQYERHQALSHGCSTGSYDTEIEEYRQLKEYISDEGAGKS
jgi:hypothetical protein